jgi:hypothetical protein
VSASEVDSFTVRADPVPVAEEEAAADDGAVEEQRRPGVVGDLGLHHVEVRREVSTGEVDRTAATVPADSDPVAERDLPVDLDAPCLDRGPGGVGDLRAGEVEVRSDVGTDEPDRAERAVAGDPDAVAQEQDALHLEAVRVDSRAAPAVEDQVGQARVEGRDRLVDRAVVERQAG